MRLIYVLVVVLSTTCVNAQSTSNIYSGGVNGFDSLIDPASSSSYRANRGGLYLHNNGWSELSHTQRLKLLDTFVDLPITIEVGFPKPNEFGHSPDRTKYHWWCDNFDDLYVKYGIKPHIIAVNLEDNINNPTLPHPTFDQWKRHHDDLKMMSPQSLVLPILGPMNIELPISTEMVSNNYRYRSIIDLAGGVVLDSPPKVFVTREDGYRMWVVNAIKYANSMGYKSALIISPDQSRSQFKTHATAMLRFLELNNALPSVYIVENYIYGKSYYNKVGKETQNNSVLGVSRFIQSRINK